ncbi:MAG: hypothetical protein U9O85_09920 [Euryarchaeota archaeon]|nr:hypothetical protein [Euryarchaeota archaeon]
MLNENITRLNTGLYTPSNSFASRHHYIFEELAKRHDVHVPHFHVSRGKERETRLIVHEATLFPVREPLLHYTLNAPFQYGVFKKSV